ncbi:hypothetical protein SEPCBS119000_002160 [Sporothrix epigloea]|uniref:Uncharacterized protein n=1 Tax=Sporothrix epigloea TaxID=1892477 RepID=A0ABP0DEP5_9PEZI
MEKRRRWRIYKKRRSPSPQPSSQHMPPSLVHQSREVLACCAELDGRPLSPESLSVMSPASGIARIKPDSTGVSRMMISARQYSASLSSPSPMSLHRPVSRTPATGNLRLRAEKCRSISSTVPPWSRLWEDDPRQLLTETPILVSVSTLSTLPLLASFSGCSSEYRSFSSHFVTDAPRPSSMRPSSLSSSMQPRVPHTSGVSSDCAPDNSLLASFQKQMANRQLLLKANKSSNGINDNNKAAGYRPYRPGESNVLSLVSKPPSPKLFCASETIEIPNSPASSAKLPAPVLFCSSPSSSSLQSSPVHSPSSFRVGRAPRSRTVPYNSSRGTSLLQAVRRLLFLPPQWSAAQTLVFLLRHPNLRRLGLPRSRPSSSSPTLSSTLSSSKLSASYRDLLNVPHCNSIDWAGILPPSHGTTQCPIKDSVPQQSPVWAKNPVTASTALSSHPVKAFADATAATASPFSASDHELVSSWLASGEPLFTRQTSMASVLLRKGLAARSRRQSAHRWRTLREAHVKALMGSLAAQSYQSNAAVTIQSQAKQYNIALNPRCRYHQLWTGAGASPLSSTTIYL